MIRLTLIIAIVFSIGCQPDNQLDEKPENVLEKEKFALVFKDIQLLEAALDKRELVDPGYRKNASAFYNEVFEKHDITLEQFNESYAWYVKHPKQLIEVYDRALTELLHEQNVFKQTAQLQPPEPISEALFIKWMESQNWEQFFESDSSANVELVLSTVDSLQTNDRFFKRFGISKPQLDTSVYAYLGSTKEQVNIIYSRLLKQFPEKDTSRQKNE